MSLPTLIAGNWKMNGLRADGVPLADAVAAGAGGMSCEILICPPATLLFPVADAIDGSPVKLGAQDCHWEAGGAFTGDIAAPMLKEAGCSYVILGHSERRHGLGESDDVVRRKAEAVMAAGMIPIICVGETESERESGHEFAVVSTQLEGSIPLKATAESVVIAYEPVWAIGTGKTASPEDAQNMHDHIRKYLLGGRNAALANDLRILYGGSMKPANASELLAQPDINGGLIGGAALKSDDFLAIAEAAG